MNRQPKGVPSGGQFAPRARPESGISLQMSSDDKIQRLVELETEFDAQGGPWDFEHRDELASLREDLYGRPVKSASVDGLRAALAKLDGASGISEDELRDLFLRVWSDEEYGPPPALPEPPPTPPRSDSHHAFAAEVRVRFPTATHIEFDLDGPSPHIDWVMSGRRPLAVGFSNPVAEAEYPDLKVLDSETKAMFEAELGGILDREGLDKFAGSPNTIHVSRRRSEPGPERFRCLGCGEGEDNHRPGSCNSAGWEAVYE